MATFVLVHGAWHGGWCWKRIAALLRQAGHEVFTPTLTGLGEREHLMHEGIDLNMHIQDILAVLKMEELNDIVLCGHSYGGMVITGVADKVPERIRSLIYLDAFVPADGQCQFDLMPIEMVARFRDEAKTRGAGFRIAPLQAIRLAVNPQDRSWVDRQCVDNSLKCFEQKLHLTGAWTRVTKRTFVYADGWGPSSFAQFYKLFQKDPAWRTVSVPCGHDVMIDMPQELVQIMIDAV